MCTYACVLYIRIFHARRKGRYFYHPSRSHVCIKGKHSTHPCPRPYVRSGVYVCIYIHTRSNVVLGNYFSLSSAYVYDGIASRVYGVVFATCVRACFSFTFVINRLDASPR